MTSDLTFFTNEPDATLLDRFKKILTDVKFFDVLVGYFRTSGFHQLYASLEDVEKIRILVGLTVDRKAFELIEAVQTHLSLDFESSRGAFPAALRRSLQTLRCGLLPHQQVRFDTPSACGGVVH